MSEPDWKMKTAVKTPTNAVTAKAAVGRGLVSPKFCTIKTKMYYIVVKYDVYISKKESFPTIMLLCFHGSLCGERKGPRPQFPVSSFPVV